LVESAGVAPNEEFARDFVAVEPQDLSTYFSPAEPGLVFGGENAQYERCSADPRCLRLVTYPEGDEVPTTLHLPPAAYGDLTRRIALIPTEELASRWYAVETNVADQVRGARAFSGVQVARFRPDSHPTLTHAWVVARGDRGLAELRFTERVGGSVDSSDWRISDAAGVLVCEVLGPAAGREEHRAVLSCDRPFARSLAIDFRSSLRTVLGTSVEDAEGRPLTRVDVPVNGTELERVPLFDI
jgi:hypothetical protein